MSDIFTHEIPDDTAIDTRWSFLGDYLAFRQELTGEVTRDAGFFLQSWVELRMKCTEDNQKHGSYFNPLTRIPIKEPVHSRIIGDFLNHQGSHGQGPLFLQCFLELLQVPEPEKGVWQISIETGRVDILLWRESPASMIIIENKVKDAVDQPNQIYRYWYHQMYLWKPKHWIDQQTKRSFRLVYMPADGSKKPAPHSLKRPADWGEEVNLEIEVPLKCEPISLRAVMMKWRETALEKVPASNHRLHVFFDFYDELWNQP